MESAPQRKIVPPETLAHTLREARAAGRTIVQCHGCFDIVHPGHIRYLQAARALGDVLVVSLTGDTGVDKGFDRPYIPQDLRAENLAALEFVDWVVVDPHPTACELLERLRPDVYVKGREYAESTDARFLREREIVERHGGRVVFHSGDVVFSSTRLIERMGAEPTLERLRLRTFCQRHAIDARSVQATLDLLNDVRVVVVGDVLAERYVVCDAHQTAEDAPVLALRQIESTDSWGGAAALAWQLRALGARPILVAVGAHDEPSRTLERRGAERGVSTVLLAARTRLVASSTFVADDARLLRVVDGGPAPLDSAQEKRLADAAREALHGARALIWCDHGYGAVTPGLVAALTPAARRADAIVAAAAPGSRGGLTGLTGADLVSLTERQLRNAVHDMDSGISSVAWRLLNLSGSQTAIVSLHRRGLIGFDGRGPDAEPSLVEPGPAHARRARRETTERLRGDFVPCFAARGVDLLGVEEAVLSTAALVLAVGGSLALATYLAAGAADLAAAQAGRCFVGADELRTWASRRPELSVAGRFVPLSSARSRAPRRTPAPLPAAEEPPAPAALAGELG